MLISKLIIILQIWLMMTEREFTAILENNLKIKNKILYLHKLSQSYY